MSSKKSNTLRFAVGSPENNESWIYRMWVDGDDVYLGARDSLKVFKVSLHRSNIWRIAFVEDLKRDNPETDRVILKWRRPAEFAPGWTPSIGILISSINAKRPFKKTKIEDSRIQWLPSPVKGKKLIIKVLFSKPEISESDFNKVTMAGDRLIGKLKKISGEVIWVVLREDDLTSVEVAKIEDVMQKTKIHLKPGSSEDSLSDSRALLVVSENIPSTRNQPTIFDISLGKENLNVSR
jgi:hypothetical protein